MDAKLINWENSLIERFYVCSRDLYPTYYLELDGYNHDADLFRWIHELHYVAGIRVVIVGVHHCYYDETLDVLNYNYEDLVNQIGMSNFEMAGNLIQNSLREKEIV